MKSRIKRRLPAPLLRFLQEVKRDMIRGSRRMAEKAGYNIARTEDFYSPLPSETNLLQNINRWNKPSALAGLHFDLDQQKTLLSDLMRQYYSEFAALPGYAVNLSAGFGLGYTEVDALLLYAMIRRLKPRHYLEVGSGLSTFYCSLAAGLNNEEHHPLQITCIEPYPYENLYTVPGVEIIKREVQDVNVQTFTALEAGDVLFIDSSHVLRIDGDVPYLYLEVLPVIKPGVIVHIHDIPFPYNVPYPAEQWVLCSAEGAPYWPVFWNEAMLLQAFLAFNPSFEILLSPTLIRYHDEQYLKENIPLYKTVREEPNTFSSIWLKRVK